MGRPFFFGGWHERERTDWKRVLAIVGALDMGENLRLFAMNLTPQAIGIQLAVEKSVDAMARQVMIVSLRRVPGQPRVA